MRIVIAHVPYLQAGGEDAVVRQDYAILGRAGLSVSLCEKPAREVLQLTRAEQIRLATTFCNHQVGRDFIRRCIRDHQPDIVHFHNLIPALGPGALKEAAEDGCAIVRTLHNYRLTCISGTHYRRDSICDSCSRGRHLYGILSACYRGSRLQSVLVACAVNTEWRFALRCGIPDIFVCLTEFARCRFIAAGLPPERVVIKPNSVDDGHPLPWREREGACFVGRLSPEKGIAQLIRSWPKGGVRLTVLGDGPLSEAVDSEASDNSSVQPVGSRDGSWVRQAMRTSRVLVLPSLSFEGLPTVALEAFSEGTPVVAFDHGWFSEFREVLGVPRVVPGDFSGLVSLAIEVAEMPERRWQYLSQRALALHADRFTHERNIRALLMIYERALDLRKKRVTAS